MTAPYVHRFQVRYSDLDSNGHVANTSYLKYSLDARWGYFESRGVTMDALRQEGFGPVVLSEKITYFKELFAYEEIEVHYWVRSLHQDGRRFELRLEIRRPDGDVSARVDVSGGWMNLETRRLDTPPQTVWAAMEDLLREDDAA